MAKHERYGEQYKPGDVFWGLGIENETYIEIKGGIPKPAEFIRHNQKRERYSVNYWTTYKPDIVNDILDRWIQKLPKQGQTELALPLLLNAHSFTKTDRFGQPMTTYTKTPQKNPKFSGTTLYEDLCDKQKDIFLEGKDVWWTFDGDSIEFMTQQFYCTNMENVVAELKQQKHRWLSALNQGLEAFPERNILLQKPCRFSKKNYGFAVFMTNQNNIGIFNNGTYHINITLPTYLDKDAKIANPTLFETQHRNAARLFQWISPFLVAKYGSGDIFAGLAGKDTRFPAGSQRLAASRYVSVGMYDTETMPRGKILTVPYTRVEERWYEKMYDASGFAYNVLPELGIDINFNKHWNHGLELRIFDWFPESQLDELLRLLIWMCDESLTHTAIENPQHSTYWTTVLTNTIRYGKSAKLTSTEADVFARILQVPELHTANTITEAYQCIWNTWKERWNNTKGTCTHKMIRTPLPSPPKQEVYHKTIEIVIPVVRKEEYSTKMDAYKCMCNIM
jgi:hypothetical protein